MVPEFRMNAGFQHMVARHLAEFDSQKHDATGLKRAAVAITIVSDSDGRASFVLTKRATTLRRHAGQWALPGGRIDANETTEQAVLRELHEEIDLELGPNSVLGHLDDYTTRSGYVITPVILYADDTVTMTANPDEVASIYRITLSSLFQPNSPEFVSIPESDRPVVRMHIAGSQIHAPTAAMLYQFREVALAGRSTRVDHLEQPVFAWR